MKKGIIIFIFLLIIFNHISAKKNLKEYISSIQLITIINYIKVFRVLILSAIVHLTI